MPANPICGPMHLPKTTKPGQFTPTAPTAARPPAGLYSVRAVDPPSAFLAPPAGAAGMASISLARPDRDSGRGPGPAAPPSSEGAAAEEAAGAPAGRAVGPAAEGRSGGGAV